MGVPELGILFVIGVPIIIIVLLIMIVVKLSRR